MDDKEAKRVQKNQDKQTAKKAAEDKKKASRKAETETKETRVELNDRARYDYGIMNAEDMDDKQLKAEMKALDDQVKDGEKENEQARKDNAEATISDSNGGVPAAPAR